MLVECWGMVFERTLCNHMLCARGTFEIPSHRQIGNEKVKTVTLLHMIINNEVGDNTRRNRYEAGNGYMKQIMTCYINKRDNSPRWENYKHRQ